MMKGSFPLTELRERNVERQNTKLTHNKNGWTERQNGRPLPAEWLQQMAAAGLSDPKDVVLSGTERQYSHKMLGTTW